VAIVLETSRLMLRPPVIGDFEAYHAAVGEPPSSAGPDAKPSREDSYKRLLANIACWNLFGYGSFAVIDRETGRLIGGCGLFRMERDVEPPLDGSPEAGWGIDRNFHGRGYAYEAMIAALDWFDQTTGEPRSICMIDDGNLASEKLAAKLRYAPCGPGRYKDVAVTIYARER
jgi:RimJ/RimL family protein N-acetyltransferase